MSLNDFENVPDPDAAIVTKMGAAVRIAMAAKEDLKNAMADAIDASTNFGYELGAEDMKLKIIKTFQENKNAEADWAISVINSMK